MNDLAAPAQTPTSDVQHGADYLFDELEKLGAHVTYTACKALVTKLYALGIPARSTRNAVIEECAKVADSVGEWLAARKIRDLLPTVPSTKPLPGAKAGRKHE